MKKSIKKIITSICAFALVFILSSCSVFLGLDSSNANDWVSETVNVELDKNLIFCDTNSYSGLPLTSQVNFNVDNSSQDLSRVEVAEKVRRSVVKIDLNTPTTSSSASGVIVDIMGGLGANEYYVLTCHHVVSGGGDITVYVPDDNARNEGDLDYDENYAFVGVIGDKTPTLTKSSVMLIGGDRDTDVAVLKLSVGNRKNKNGQSVSIVKSTVAPSTYQYKYAEEVFAIGNPSGSLPMTYLDGVISYENRLIRLDPVGYMNLLQLNCLITHGSSGGGLFNMKGQLIGITNAGSDQDKGMNYAIPFSGEEGFVEIATKLIKSNTTKNFGYIDGRWSLGVSIKTADNSVNGSKVVIDYVETNSNAYGLLEEGDYVINIKCVKDGYEDLNYDVASESEFKEIIYVLREYVEVGDTIQFTVSRRSAT